MPHPLSVIAAMTLAVAAIIPQASALAQGTNLSTSAPLATDSAGIQGKFAATSVFRVICPEQNEYGTGFLHKSGVIITAAHVTDGCTKIVVGLPDNTTVAATLVASDDRTDLAIIKPANPIDGTPLALAADAGVNVGQEIGIWGFPAGYIGLPPMLSVGYVAGLDAVRSKTGVMVPQLVVNAAVNHGDSGGPVILIETGEVIGIADNKLVPMSPVSLAALAALQSQNSGFMYPARMPDGTTKNFSEAQVVAMVLEELRQQVQLVVGHTILLSDIQQFLRSNKIDP